MVFYELKYKEMLDVHEALKIVLSESQNYGKEKVSIQACVGRFLAEDVVSDRDSPPFDRVMMDGIAIQLGSLDQPLRTAYPVQGTQAAGMPQMTLKSRIKCLEVMTGAVLPRGADTVIPYEAIRIENGQAYPQVSALNKRHIHYQGRDCQKGLTMLYKGKKINTGDVGILATVGKDLVEVAKNPKVAVVATGNELVEVNEKPQKHQIRKSNVYALVAALLQGGIQPTMFHLADEWDNLYQNLSHLIEAYDVLLLSGGVSRGKYDLVPDVLQTLGVEKRFHCVAQQPGKPFWFGKHSGTSTKIFAFPGNPISTFVGYHYYFRQWLHKSLGNPLQFPLKYVTEPLQGNENLARFVLASLNPKTDGAILLSNNGSGDLFSLARAEGFILLPRSKSALDNYKPGDRLPFIGF